MVTGSFGVLSKSFRLLLEDPRLFVPKLVSTILSSFFVIGVLESSWLKQLIVVRPISTVLVVFLAMFFLGVIGVVASLMVASLVRDSQKELITAFYEIKDKTRQIIGVALFFFVLSVFLAVLVVAAQLVYSVGMVYLAGFIVLAGLGLLVFVVFYGYFLPITVLEKDSLIESAKESMIVSGQNRKEVSLLTFVSLLLLVFAVFVANSSELKTLGYAGFLLGRLTSTVVNTYLFVVSPTFYLEN